VRRRSRTAGGAREGAGGTTAARAGSPRLSRVTRTLPRRLAVATAITAAPLLSSCGVNFNAQTDQVYTPADGMNERDGSVDVLNALIVSGEPGSGRLIAGLSNNDERRPDALTEVRGAGADRSVSVAIQGDGEAAIPAGGYLQLADPDAAFVAVQGDPSVVDAGNFVRVTFVFKNAEPATLNVPVLPPGSDYAGVSLTGPSASASPSESGSPSTSSPSPSPTPEG